MQEDMRLKMPAAEPERARLSAMSDTTETSSTASQADRDFESGVWAFPMGQWMDAQRGKRGYPAHVRCPFRRPERVAAWKRGYSYAHAQAMNPT